jgi:hypothetical protein
LILLGWSYQADCNGSDICGLDEVDKTCIKNFGAEISWKTENEVGKFVEWSNGCEDGRQLTRIRIVSNVFPLPWTTSTGRLTTV